MDADCDALVIGAGVAGTSAAILLAQAGWQVVLVEQHAYPRRKVCGECVAAANLPLLDALGVGAEFRRAAGPELRRVGWMDAAATVSADMPCSGGPYPYGRALGRDRLDTLLLERARAAGVLVLQPAKARSVRADIGGFDCTIESTVEGPHHAGRRPGARTLRAAVVIDAHGSWERGPFREDSNAAGAPRRGSDLFAFKANFRNTSLEPGFLPVFALRGGYGGMVVGDDGRTTLACCLRRDALAACRARAPGTSAGLAVEALLRRSCGGVRAVLQNADRDGTWLSVGPLRPGIRVDARHGAFRVGNAAGESHPLIGEGISMALQSSALLAGTLSRYPAAAITGRRAADLHGAYAAAWRRSFAPRLRLAAIYAHIAMRPALAGAARAVLRRWPMLLCSGARWAGKATRAPAPSFTTAEIS
ncbi:MAG: FAD-dependent oxidoreductase [Steroidobacteraceae bacterium]|jgi:2-polyprenyl-6-methoxyphenol hydroxylase-like FAD-dependent oxidoreductase